MMEYQKNTFTGMDNPVQLVLSPEDLGAGVRTLSRSFLNVFSVVSSVSSRDRFRAYRSCLFGT